MFYKGLLVVQAVLVVFTSTAFSINDVLVGDHQGRLSHPDGHNKTAAFHSFMKLYVGRGWFKNGNTARAWIDDVELHTDPPPEVVPMQN